MQQGIALAALAIVPAIDHDDWNFITGDGETAHFLRINGVMRTSDNENQNVLVLKPAPPEVERTIISCGVALTGVGHAKKSTEFLSYGLRLIAKSGPKPERSRRFAKVIVQL